MKDCATWCLVIVTGAMAIATGFLAFFTYQSINFAIEQTTPKLDVKLGIPDVRHVDVEFWGLNDEYIPLRLSNLRKTNIIILNILVTSDCLNTPVSFTPTAEIILTETNPYNETIGTIPKSSINKSSKLPCKFEISIIGSGGLSWIKTFEYREGTV